MSSRHHISGIIKTSRIWGLSLTPCSRDLEKTVKKSSILLEHDRLLFITAHRWPLSLPRWIQSIFLHHITEIPFHSAITSRPRSSKWPQHVFPHYLRTKFSSPPFMLHDPLFPQAPHVQFFPHPYHHNPEPRPCATSSTLLFLLYRAVSARLTPRLEEARLPAVRDCLPQFPSHSVLNVNHTMETMSVCLSSQ